MRGLRVQKGEDMIAGTRFLRMGSCSKRTLRGDSGENVKDRIATATESWGAQCLAYEEPCIFRCLHHHHFWDFGTMTPLHR